MKAPTTKTTITYTEEPVYNFGQLQPGTFYKSANGQTIYMKLQEPVKISDKNFTSDAPYNCNAIDVKPANNSHAPGTPFFHSDELVVEIVKEVSFIL